MMKKYSELLVIILLWTVAVYNITIAIRNHYVLDYSNYIGYTAILLVSILKVLRIKRIKTILTIILVIGTINLLRFTCADITFFFNWKPFGNEVLSIGIQPLSFLFLVLFFILNFSEVRKYYEDNFGEDLQDQIELQKNIDKQAYEDLKNEQNEKLEEIVKNKNEYSHEYFKAARRILIEKGTYKY